MEQALVPVSLSILVIRTRDAAPNAFSVQTVQKTELASITNAMIRVLERAVSMRSVVSSTTFLHAAVCPVTRAILYDLALLSLQLVRTFSHLPYLILF
jgi:hypothetical protein